MNIITKEGRCEKCNKLLDLVEGMEWIPNYGLYCQPCAEERKALMKSISEIQKERNQLAWNIRKKGG